MAAPPSVRGGCRRPGSPDPRLSAHLTAPVIIDAAEHRRGLPHAFVSSVGARNASRRDASDAARRGGTTPVGSGTPEVAAYASVGLAGGASCLVSRDRRVLLVRKVMLRKSYGPGWRMWLWVSRRLHQPPWPAHARKMKARYRPAQRTRVVRVERGTANTAVRYVQYKPNRNPCRCTPTHAPRQPTPNILTKKPTEETRCTHTTQPRRTVVAGNAQRLVSGSVRPTPHGGEE